MRVGIVSDTHDELARTALAIPMLRAEGSEALIPCGDLASPPIVVACSVLTCWFVFGNHDADNVSALEQAARDYESLMYPHRSGRHEMRLGKEAAWRAYRHDEKRLLLQ